MPSNQNNNVLIRELPMVLTAQWEVDGVMKTIDSNVNGDIKPTLLIGSKRRQKVATFPTLHLKARFVEAAREGGVVSNVVVDEMEGKEVVFEVTNKFYRTPAKKPIEYGTKLHNFEAVIELSGSELRDVIFKKDGQLNARVNQNLLDFAVRIPDLGLSTNSENRLLIYRNRVIVFVPGLLGSTIAIKTSTGLVNIYPNIYPTMSADQESQVLRILNTTLWFTPGGCAFKAGGALYEIVSHRHLGVLECDAAGKPLFEAKAELFRLLGAVPGTSLNKHLAAAIVYDVQDVLAERWTESNRYTNCPKGFLPFTLMPWAYDWRLDLENAAQHLFQGLRTIQKKLLSHSDSDDLLTISGHSTGGVINRRVCGLPGIGQLVEQSFFMNVPFRGAPKALSVMLFGGAPPMQGLFTPMMPWQLIEANSMIHIAENLPIMYFLSPSQKYPDVVSTLSGDICTSFAIQPTNDREREKEDLLRVAIATGIYQPVRSISPSAPLDEKANLAKSLTEWHERWWDCGRRKAYGVFWDPPQLEAYNHQKLTADEDLRFHDSKRLQATTGWNRTIAANAARFHSVSEALIDNSPVELFVFWSRGTITTGSVDMQFDGPSEEMNVLTMGIDPVRYLNDGLYPTYDIGDAFDFRFQWWTSHSTRQWVKFSSVLVDGDGTVPRASLLGIGTSKAKVFSSIPNNPEHVPAPNADYVWDRVLDVLTGRDVSSHLVQVDAKNEPAPSSPIK